MSFTKGDNTRAKQSISNPLIDRKAEIKTHI